MNNNDYDSIIETELSGKDLMSNPVLNKGTAFNYEERIQFDLHGLLPPVIETLEQQCVRAYEAYKRKFDNRDEKL
jgi:malate dehydrogenase (oxaloacetate-decarboxylating)